jgi:hypothetical protein
MEVDTKRKRRPSAKDGAQEHSPVLKKLKEVKKEATKEIKCPDCGGLHSAIWNSREHQLEVSFSYTTHHLPFWPPPSPAGRPRHPASGATKEVLKAKEARKANKKFKCPEHAHAHARPLLFGTQDSTSWRFRLATPPITC